MHKKHKNILKIACFMLLGAPSHLCFAYINTLPPSSESKLWLKSLDEFNLGLNLPLRDHVKILTPPIAKLKTRVWSSPSNKHVEPVTIHLPATLAAIENFSKKFTNSTSYPIVRNHLLQRLDAAKLTPPKTLRIQVDKQLWPYLDKAAFAARRRIPHHSLTLDTARLRKAAHLQAQILEQLQPFFSKEAQQKITKKIANQDSLRVDSDLLPKFAREVVGQYSLFQGPNCFHASLAFHHHSLTASRYYNVAKEKGYHPAMINYDELWRTLGRSFYPVPQGSQLKYGDILVFFDLPQSYPSSAAAKLAPPNFRWIRHTATYLFNAYTFSKGSKSAESPYAVKALEEEWQTWSRLTKNLAVKAFRRSTKNVRRQPPVDLTDWVY